MIYSKKLMILVGTIITVLFIICGCIVTNIIISDVQTSYTTERKIAGINTIRTNKFIEKNQERLIIGIDRLDESKINESNTEKNEKEINDKQNEEQSKIETEENLKNPEKNNEEENKRQNVLENTTSNQQGSIQENVQEIQDEQNIGNNDDEIKKETIETTYNGYNTVGKIEIPATGVDTPILDKVTVQGMKMAPCLLCTTSGVNENGNTYIVGHNYQNNTLFSNNNKLTIGDKIYITSQDGTKLEYTIYSKFITTEDDVSYLKRDTNNLPEITLQCCTNDENQRIIILGKVVS